MGALFLLKNKDSKQLCTDEELQMCKELVKDKPKLWKIQTYTFDKNGKLNWVDCEHKTWFELKEDGWDFQYLEPTNDGGIVCMTRGGYINEFRMVEVTKK